MSEVEEITKDFRDIFCHYKENQNRSMFQVLNQIKSSNCKHKERTLCIQNKMNCLSHPTGFYKTLLCAICFILTSATYGMWLIRRYNHANIYGGCPTSFFWPFEDCPVAF